MAKLESLDLNKLLVLHWLLETAHVTRAALQLGTTQPAVSRSLRELRQWFDDPLLARDGHVLVRTPFAETLRPRITRLIAELRELTEPRARFDPASASGIVRLACTDYVAALVLAAWDARVLPVAPGLDLELVSPSGLREEQFESGSIDMMVLPARKKSSGGLMHVSWMEDRYATLVRADHPLAGRRVGWKRFAELEHVQVITGIGGVSEVDRAFRAHGLQRRVALRVGNFTLAVRALAHGSRVATLPSSVKLAAPVPLLELHTPLDLPAFSLDLVFHPRMLHQARHVFLRNALVASAR